MGTLRIKLIATDLDGTLLLTDRAEEKEKKSYRVAPEGAKALQMAAAHGVHVVIATARTIRSTRDLCAWLGLSAPVICLSGSQIYDSIDGPVWRSLSIQEKAVRAIAEHADKNNWPLSINCGQVTCYGGFLENETGEFEPGRIRVSKNRDGIRGDVNRILVHGPEAISGIQQFCETRLAGQYRIEPYTGPDGNSLGIYSHEADKGTALDLVMERLGINPDEVMAIGDDLHDLPMFSKARIKVAMQNGHPKMKEQATVVAPSNVDEGVAWAVRKFVLIK